MNVPLLCTNYNMMYAISADAKFQVYYPAHLKTDGVKLGSGQGGVGANPRMTCVLNTDCHKWYDDWMNEPYRDGYGNKVKKSTWDWKDNPGSVDVVGFFEASSSDWSLMYDSIKSDCASCSLKAEELCTSTTDVYITGSVGPDPVQMPRMHGLVGDVEFEELEPLACRDVIGCGATGICPALI